MHDLDKNGKLDGIELIKAITHFHSGKHFCTIFYCLKTQTKDIEISEKNLKQI